MAAPVTVLAQQHYTTLLKFIAELPKKKQPRVALLTGSTRSADRREILEGLESGSIDILIGTHALFNQKVEYKNLAFVTIDEQHRCALHVSYSLWLAICKHWLSAYEESNILGHVVSHIMTYSAQVWSPAA